MDKELKDLLYNILIELKNVSSKLDDIEYNTRSISNVYSESSTTNDKLESICNNTDTIINLLLPEDD